MLKVPHPWWQGYTVAALSVLLALLLSFLLESLLPPGFSPLFVVAIVISSRFGGLTPGLLAVVLSILVNNFFFPPSIDSGLNLMGASVLQLVAWGFVTWLIQVSPRSERQQQNELAEAIDKLAKMRAKRELDRQRLRAILDILPVGVFVADAQGRLLENNAAAKDIWGEAMPLADQVSDYQQYRGWWSSTGKPLTSDDWALARAIATGEALIGEEIDIESFDGQRKTILNSAIPIRDQKDEVVGAVAVNVEITDRKRMEVALQNSEARLRRIIDSNVVGFFFGDMSGSITEANDAFLQMLGYTEEDLRAGQLHWKRMTVPESETQTQQAVQELQQHGVCTPFEKEFFRKDGSRVSVMLAAALFEDASEQGFSWVLDITDRKQIEAERDRNELLFRTLTDTMPQMLWVTQADGYHEYFNQRWYDYTGAAPEQTQGEGWQTILHPDDVQRTIEVWQHALRTGTAYEIEYRLRCAANGEYRWHLGRALPLHDQGGQIVKWFGSCTDIHDQKVLIEERAQALDRERTVRIELENANRLKDEFLAIVSHELRSPLNPIVGWAQILRTRKLSAEKTDQALEIIERNAKLQAHLVDDLLDVSRILRGKLSLDLRPVDLEIPMAAALETVRLTAEAKAIDLNFSIAEKPLDHEFNPLLQKKDSKFIILGDTNRLQQIVWNLLTNAIKFTEPGGKVYVTLAKQILKVSQPLQDTEKQQDTKPSSSQFPAMPFTYAVISVSDTGKGISPDFLPYVFERFRQADEATTRKFGGLGLGLAIVRHLVELHGGSIQVASPGIGLGTTFTVMLPLIFDSSQIDEKPGSTASSACLEGLRLVVVDDTADTLQLLTFILEDQGAEVIAVSSAQEALDAIVTTSPHLLLSDIAMPGTDGHMLIQQVRALETPSDKPLPAIALTAFAGEGDRERIMAGGFQKHLTKPVEPDALIKAVAELAWRKRHNEQ